jgi:CxxC motif-containing protein (DUF1111 family)
VGLIDAIADVVIAVNAIPNGPVHGRAHRVRGADGRERIGRFGWKAETATLRQFVAEAFRNALGITSPLAPVDLSRGAAGRRRCAADHAGLEDDGTLIDAVTAFLATLLPPPHTSERGLALFAGAGCAACHVPELPAPGAVVPLYSDLLLHDLGPDLTTRSFKVGQAGAIGERRRSGV